MKTLPEFIAFYESIPEDQWMAKDYTNGYGKCCAYGHLGCRRSVASEDANQLEKIIGYNFELTSVNDGEDKNYQQATPKKRVLAALKALLTVLS